MTRLYLDHNVSLHLVPPLQAEGHLVTTARDRGLARLTDDAQLLAAVRAGSVLVTHNRGDFALLHDAWVTWPAAFGLALPPHQGILILDLAPHQTLAAVMAAFLSAAPPAPLAVNTFWWHRHEGWRRRLVGAGWERHPSQDIVSS